MGEYAEMMLDGTLCESCGDYIGADNDCPAQCRACVIEAAEEEKQLKKQKESKQCYKS